MVRTMPLITISAPNWDKFNPRSDRANYTWFRLQNDFLHDQVVFSLTDAQRVLYLFCLCELSKKNSKSVELLTDYISSVLRKKEKEIISGLNVLSERKLIAVIMPAESRKETGKEPASLPATLRYVTNETNVTHTPLPPKSVEPISRNVGAETPPAVCAGQEAGARAIPPGIVFPDKSAGLQRVVQEWGKTLKHYGRDRNPQTDEVQLLRVVNAHGEARTINAIRGFRVEEKRPGYDPAKYVSVGRLLATDKFLALEALGESIRAKKPEIDWSKIGKGES